MICISIVRTKNKETYDYVSLSLNYLHSAVHSIVATWERSPETGLSASPRTLSARSTDVSRGLGGNESYIEDRVFDLEMSTGGLVVDRGGLV